MSADLAPGRTALPGAGPAGNPGGTFLTRAYIFLLICIPSVWVVGPLGAVGAPAGLLGCGFLLAWLAVRLTAGRSRLGGTPVHWLLLVFVAGFAAALCSAARRPLLAEEYSAVLRGIVTVAGWLGVALFTADVLRSRARLLAAVRFLVGTATLLALAGYLQFATGINLVDHLHVPGLTLHDAAIGIYERDGFRRVNGTAIHAIEYATVLSMVLPLAISQAVRRRTAWSVAQTALIAGALPLTVSRSGAVGLALGFVYALIVVGRRARRIILAMVPVAVAAVVMLVPGLLGTIRGLFLSAGTDTSITARTDDYPAVEAFFRAAPWLGRGPFTFIPTIYRTLDNQYLGTLVEGGLVGLLTMVALLMGSGIVAFRIARRLPHGPDRVLANALATALLVAMVMFATFDAYSFPMAMGTVFLTIGLVGAAARSFAGPRDASGPVRPVALGRRLSRRATVHRVVGVGLAIGVLAVGSAFVVHARPAYAGEVTLAIAVPPHPGENIYFAHRDTTGVTDILYRVMESPAMRAHLADEGIDNYEVAIGTGSLGPYTDQLGYGDVMHVRAIAAGPRAAAAQATTVSREIGRTLADVQAGKGIPASLKVEVVNYTAPDVSELAVHRSVGLGAAALLATLTATTAAALLGRREREAGIGSSPARPPRRAVAPAGI